MNESGKAYEAADRAARKAGRLARDAGMERDDAEVDADGLRKAYLRGYEAGQR